MMRRVSLKPNRTRQGRHTAASSKAAMPSRKATAPEAPTSGNSPFANAAPIWKQSIATIRPATGTAIG